MQQRSLAEIKQVDWILSGTVGYTAPTIPGGVALFPLTCKIFRKHGPEQIKLMQ